MDLSAFIGKPVTNPANGKRYILSGITAPTITAVMVDSRYPNGIPYVFPTINDDPLSNGTLVFEDAALLEPFKIAYVAYCRTADAYWEEVGYWMRKD